MEFRVSLTPRAEKDLKQIGLYIAQTDVRIAYRFCDELVIAAETLQTFPDIGMGVSSNVPTSGRCPIKLTSSFIKLMKRQKLSKSFASGTAQGIKADCV